jgi:hypothetical protein
MWRYYMTQYLLTATKLDHDFSVSYRSEAQKPKPNNSASLKGAKGSWGCYRLEDHTLLELTPFVIRRDDDDEIIISGAAKL